MQAGVERMKKGGGARAHLNHRRRQGVVDAPGRQNYDRHDWAVSRGVHGCNSNLNVAIAAGRLQYPDRL